jgi:hypothetical protein
MSPIRTHPSNRLWAELPDGFGRHLVTVMEVTTVQWPAVAEVALLVTFAPHDEQPEGLGDLGLLEPGQVIEQEGLVGRWEVVSLDGDLRWEPAITHGGEVHGSLREHRFRLRLRPEGARYK